MELSLENRRALRRPAAILGAGVILATVAVSFAMDNWPAQRFLVLYVVPLFVALAAWIWLRLGEGESRFSRPLVMLDIAVIGVAALRFFTGLLPISGHMLFLVYSGITQRALWYRQLAAALLVETSFFKLHTWDDPRSWALGGIAGLMAAGLHRANVKRGR